MVVVPQVLEQPPILGPAPTPTKAWIRYYRYRVKVMEKILVPLPFIDKKTGEKVIRMVPPFPVFPPGYFDFDSTITVRH